jgi:hypothetical protein
MIEAAYLVGKPTGTPLAMLIVALVLFAMAALCAAVLPARPAPPRDLFGMFAGAGLLFLTLAFLVS